MKTISKPKLVLFYLRKDFFVGDGVHVADDEELFAAFDYPGKELAEEGEGWVGDDEIGLIAQAGDLFAAEVAIFLQVIPNKILEVDLAFAGEIVREGEDLAVGFGFGGVEAGAVDLEEGGLVAFFVGFAVEGVTGADEFFEAETLEVLCKVLGEVAPFGVITGEEDGLAAKDIGVVFEVGGDLFFDVVVLGVELVVFGFFGFGKVAVWHGNPGEKGEDTDEL